jgi:hypothetical protein
MRQVNTSNTSADPGIAPVGGDHHTVAVLDPSKGDPQPTPSPAVFPGPAAYPGYVVPPPPKPSRAGLIVSVVAGVVALLCLGASITTFFVVRNLAEPEDKTARPLAVPTVGPTETPTGVPTDPSTKPPATAVVHDGDVKRLMMSPPAGARKWPDVKAVEALTLTTATADLAGLGLGAPGDLGEEDLDGVGFTDGYVRRWIDKHDTYVTVRIYRFDHAGGGLEFANNEVGTAEGADWGSVRNDIKGNPNAASFVQPNPGNGVQSALVIGGFSDIAIVVTTRQRPPAAATVAKSVFGTEYKKL